MKEGVEGGRGGDEDDEVIRSGKGKEEGNLTWTQSPTIC
jgi:hypothetical protein